jgi:predicted CoA-binding protein
LAWSPIGHPFHDAGIDAVLRRSLLSVKAIGMVGASDKETRPYYGVFAFLLARGHQMTGVNPSVTGSCVHGTVFFKTLADIPGPVDMAEIFRNSAAAGAVVDEALALDPKPKVIWMQLVSAMMRLPRGPGHSESQLSWTAARRSTISAWQSGKRRMGDS